MLQQAEQGVTCRRCAGGLTSATRSDTCVQKSGFMHKDWAADIVLLFLCKIYVHNDSMIYGYARVATDGQSVEAQVRQLAEAGCEKTYREVASGAQADRAQLGRVLAALGPGDVLVVTRLDRLARSTHDLLNTLATISGRQAGF